MKNLPHISGAIIAIVIVYLISLIQEGHPVLSYDRQYSHNVVEAGQVIYVKSDVDRSHACSSTISRTWIDQNGNILLQTMTEVPYYKAGHEQFKAHITVPANAQSGILRQRVKTVFYCNWLQRFLNIGAEFIMPDVIFEVSKKDP